MGELNTTNEHSASNGSSPLMLSVTELKYLGERWPSPGF